MIKLALLITFVVYVVRTLRRRIQAHARKKSDSHKAQTTRAIAAKAD